MPKIHDIDSNLPTTTGNYRLKYKNVGFSEPIGPTTPKLGQNNRIPIIYLHL